jgi:hypothetical protein
MIYDSAEIRNCRARSILSVSVKELRFKSDRIMRELLSGRLSFPDLEIPAIRNALFPLGREDLKPVRRWRMELLSLILLLNDFLTFINLNLSGFHWLQEAFALLEPKWYTYWYDSREITRAPVRGISIFREIELNFEELSIGTQRRDCFSYNYGITSYMYKSVHAYIILDAAISDIYQHVQGYSSPLTTRA